MLVVRHVNVREVVFSCVDFNLDRVDLHLKFGFFQRKYSFHLLLYICARLKFVFCKVFSVLENLKLHVCFLQFKDSFGYLLLVDFLMLVHSVDTLEVIVFFA